MKVKSLVNISSCVRYEIHTKDNYIYDVDYLRKAKDCYKFSLGEGLTSFAHVPQSVLDSCVDMVSVNTATKALRIYTK